MALTDIFVRQVKDTGKPAGDKYADGGGLYLHVKASGKYWRMAYRFVGKQKTLAIGVYPAVSLAQARKVREKARELLAQDSPIDPGTAKREAKNARAVAATNTFEATAREFHAQKLESWSGKRAKDWLRRLEKDLFPYIGKTPLAEVTAPMLLAALRRVEARGILETARRLRQHAGQIFKYGIQTGRCDRDPAADLIGALKPVIVKNMAAILEPAKVGELCRAIWSYAGQPATKAAAQLSALLFQRPGNIRAMEWSWLDLDAAMLTIPSASMKRTVQAKQNGRPHLVPLAPQAVEILRDLYPLTGGGRYVFPALTGNTRPMSENTVNQALRRMGFAADEMTAHGFRSMARTVIAENLPGIAADVVEAQLAHGKAGPLGAAYDRAEYMAERRKMMSAWADYLDKLRLGADVIPMKRPA